MTIEEILRGRLTIPVAEAARLLGVGLSTLYDAIERKEVPNAGIGTAKRVPAWFLVKKLTPQNARNDD
jgi:excisionase family DNA binding protein